MPRRSPRSLWTAKLTGKSASAQPDATIGIMMGPPTFRGTILGIDPSLRGSGFAILDANAPADQAQLRHSHTLRLKTNLTMHQCLGEIATLVSTLIEQYRPDCCVVEQTIYVQNFQTAQILGAARGAAIGIAAMHRVPVHEYAPLRIKQAVVGFGRASKEQVAALVRQRLDLPADLPFDEADAAAAALCHALTWRESTPV